MAIQIYNRRTGQLETEMVFQRWFMTMAYGTPLGRASATLLWSRKWFSRLYGVLQRSRMSRRKIRRFVERHGCGAVVSPGDAAQAFAVLKQWYEQPALYEKLSAAAAQAAAGYLWQVMEARLLDLYKELLNGS